MFKNTKKNMLKKGLIIGAFSLSVPFLAISKIIMSILRDRNYIQNNIEIPKNLDQIIDLDNWARKKTFSIINKFYA